MDVWNHSLHFHEEWGEKNSSWACPSQGWYLHLLKPLGSSIQAQQSLWYQSISPSVAPWQAEPSWEITVTAIRCHKSIRSLLREDEQQPGTGGMR